MRRVLSNNFAAIESEAINWFIFLLRMEQGFPNHFVKSEILEVFL